MPFMRDIVHNSDVQFVPGDIAWPLMLRVIVLEKGGDNSVVFIQSNGTLKDKLGSAYTRSDML